MEISTGSARRKTVTINGKITEEGAEGGRVGRGLAEEREAGNTFQERCKDRKCIS